MLRRVWFGLTGLPPSPEAVDAFLEDDDERAIERVVDGLLASPHYGERWGRHWLDVARYGDSNGGDENHAYAHAFRYRNWVIDALNRDLPFDRFVKAQLAGDSSLPNDTTQLAATGFLAIGTKILAEQDPIKKRADTINEQLDTLGRAFMGLSLGCARCHAHKFDPISEQDYYALAGILYSTDITELDLKTPERLQSEADWKLDMQILEKHLSTTRDRLQNAAFKRWDLEWEAETFARGNVIIDHEQYGKGIGIIGDPGAQDNYVEYDLDIKMDGLFLVEVRYAAENPRPGRILFDGEPLSGAAMTAATGGWMPEHQRWHMEGGIELVAGAHVMRIESKPMMSHIDRVRITSFKDPHKAKAWLVEMQGLESQIILLEKERPRYVKVMAVAEGTIQNARVNLRGNPHQLGKEVPRGFLTGIGVVEPPMVGEDSSGRRELAEWMTSPDHPLTARVMVNRIWHWHFGRGLVSTPDNFGRTGQSPTHPALLDWLTMDFIRHGFSLKHLHRRIVLSNVYQLSSNDDQPVAMRQDPSNRLYWKGAVRRLDAEAFRDALLSVSGSLDSNAHSGEPIQVTSQNPSPQDLIANRVAYESFPRRSVYLPVVRSHIYDLLALLDFPNATTPVGRRSETTVPTQALLMFNSTFVIEKARETSQRVLDEAITMEERLVQMYRLLFARRPSALEQASCASFLKGCSAWMDDAEGWGSLCHTLMISNEFMHVW
ncbi:MAG: DUF1553 domain-containing protein [Verrucomicrobiota bacterium]|nr:DUF1553 domain-containing protein [Verrucomicrobiota bacterium]